MHYISRSTGGLLLPNVGSELQTLEIYIAKMKHELYGKMALFKYLHLNSLIKHNAN